MFDLEFAGLALLMRWLLVFGIGAVLVAVWRVPAVCWLFGGCLRDFAGVWVEFPVLGLGGYA